MIGVTGERRAMKKLFLPFHRLISLEVVSCKPHLTTNSKYHRLQISQHGLLDLFLVLGAIDHHKLTLPLANGI